MKMWMNYVLLVVFLTSFSLLQGQDRSAEIKIIKKDVEHLSSDKLKGREAGSKEEKHAAEYIAKRFKDIGLFPLGDDGTYLQHFDFPKSKDPHSGKESEEKLSGMNVVGYIDNSADNNVILGAHFDHLGMGGSGSFHETEAIHNGADDNASGVAMIINLAERLKASKYKRNNYIIIAFTGEEKGLYGSNYFLKHPPYYLNTMNYMINFDMVGRLNPEKGIVINGVGTSPIWTTIIEKANTGGMKYKTTESGVGPSDHTSFYMKDIPAIHFFTGSHEDYHRPSDDADKINYDGMIQISDFVYNIIGDLNTKLKLAFTRTKEADDANARATFKVTMGVIPDYLFDGSGMKIDGVKEDRPAAKAGLQAGDIVIKLGDHDVTDMNSYMKGLNQFDEGSKTIVRVKRGEEELDFNIEF